MKTMFFRLAKPAIFVAVAFISFTMSAFAKPSDVSKYLVKQFENQFHHASDVTWKTTDAFISATFTMDNQKTIVFYTQNNDLIAVSKVITAQDLPKAAQNTLARRYAGQTIVSVIDYTDAESNENYYIELENDNRHIILQSDINGAISDFKK